MKKLTILLFIFVIATGCAVGTYYPHAQNTFGAQSEVVINQANFRVVRDVEAIVDVNNTRLSRADAANSAYGELLRKAQLTGSQVLINVVIEEVRRESGGFFRLLFGMPKRVQHVSARATIIEFLDKNGNPNASETSHSNNSSRISSEYDETSLVADFQQIEQVNSQLKALAPKLHTQEVYVYTVLKIYNKIYKSLLNAGRTQELMKIQAVMLNYFNTHKNAYTNLESELTNASSIDEQVQVFLSYSK